ncbi:MAG: hypothetical protein RL625_822, partial [Gemmatimonadota bacterium]
FPRQLPITPIADLEARDDDLVLSTQGRSLWVVDDVSPLRELSATVTASAAHLFAPAPAVRAQKGMDPFDPQPGLPDQPSNGAVLHYWLGNASAGPVTLEIRDAARRTVRVLTSDSAAARTARTPRLAMTRGLHRVVWDLTYAGPRAIEGQVVWGYVGGIKAPPGSYELLLTANGVTMRRTVTVTADPRLPQITAAEYAEQFRIASTVRDSLDALNRTLQELREVRTQLEGLTRAAARVGEEGTLRPMIEALTTKLQGLETRFTQTKSRSGQDPIRFAGQLDNQWAELYGNVTGPNGYIAGGPEGRPTKAATERLAELSARWERLRLTWQEVVTKDIPALNATAQRLTLGGIAIPQGAVVP